MSGSNLLHVFSTFAVGGPQVRFAAQANRFGSQFRHLIVAMDGRTDCLSRIGPEVPVTLPAVAIRKGRTLANLQMFRRALRTLAPDVLVTYNWGAIEWAMANWPGLVRHLHIEDGFGPEEAQGQLGRRVWTRRLVLRRSSVIVPSRNLEGIATSVWHLDKRRVRYIPNGIDCARFAAPRDPAVVAQCPGSGPIIGTVAALRREKNLQRLLLAFRRVAERLPCRLAIVGDGPERAPLETLAAEIGIKDRLWIAGHVERPETVYPAFDVFALSSDTEQMPYTIIEAMAAGLPIAATDVGDISHMVAAENLPYLTPLSDEGLAAAIERLLADAAMRARIGAANRRKAREEYDQERMFRAYAAMFRGEEPEPDDARARLEEGRAP